jgi:membrane fusion protein, multidrug efflux system
VTKKTALLALLLASPFTFAVADTAGTPPIVRAQLTARNSAAVAAEIGAKVRRLHVTEGGSFEKGAPLVSFDDSLQQSQVARAEAVLTAAQRTLAINQRLHRLNSIGQIELDLSETEVVKAQAELAYSKAMLAKCTLAAPFSGRVAELRIHEQEFAQPGQTLLEIIDDATPEVDFIAPSKWLSWLRIGQPLEISVEETGTAYTARVERIGARVDPISQSVKVVAIVTQSSPELMAGMSGTIRMAPPEKHSSAPIATVTPK